MSNEQLAVLLYHLMRQINQATSVVEQVLINHGCSPEFAGDNIATIELRGLANVLESQVKKLNNGISP